MYAIVLDTPSFVEVQYTTQSQNNALEMFDILNDDMDGDYTLFLVQYDEEDVDDVLDWYDEFETESSAVKVLKKYSETPLK